MNKAEGPSPVEEVGGGSQTTKTSTRPYSPDSLEDEGAGDVEECRRNLQMFDKFGLTLYLRKLATSAKMAADRIDYSEHLRGNTLEEYITEDQEKS